MATFRKYGGTNYSPIANIVRHNMFNSKSSSFTTSGLYNSKETFLSHIDMSGNSLLHLGNLYFQDGTSISSANIVNIPLSTVLSYGNSAGSNNINMNGQSINNINSLQINGTTQDSAYTGFNTPGTYKSATLKFNSSGKIIDVIDNSMSPFGLEQVLTTSNSAGSNDINMSGKNINDANSIKVNSIQINGTTQDSAYTGFNTPGTYKSATLKFDTSGKILDVIDNSMSPFGLSQVLTTSENGGGKSITDVNNIAFTGSLNQTGTNTNTLNSTVFNTLCSYSPGPLSFTSDYQIPNKGYVDSIASGLLPTTLCNCATTQDISFSGVNVPTTIDGVTLANNYRVLVKCQDSSNNVSSSKVSNGIYVYTSGSLVRASDCSGNDVSNQLTFISDGSLNGMKAFVQSNSSAIAGTNPLIYVPFYSLNYNLGHGLELAGGSTLQVESSLNFLTSVVITNDATPINNAFQLTNTSQTNQIFASLNLYNTNYNNITQSGDNGIFSGNQSDPSYNAPPLVLSTWKKGGQPNGIRITNNSVRLQSDSTNWYDLSGGHKFYGNLIMNSDLSANRQITTGYLNLAPISGSPVATGTQIYQNSNVMTFDNNVNTSSNYNSSYLFACNNLGDDSKQTTPLSFNSSFLLIDLSNNLSSSSKVRYYAYNDSYYGSQIGHNFYGNMYLNTTGNYLQFPDGTKQYSAAVASNTILYTSNRDINIPDNCYGITVVLISKGGAAGYTYMNDPYYYSGGSGSGGNVLSSRTIMNFAVGTTLKIIFVTGNGNAGYSQLLLSPSTNIMKAYNGNKGGDATAISAGTGGNANSATSEFNSSIVNCTSMMGTNGFDGYMSNTAFQFIPTSAGHSALRSFVNGDYGCGQLHVNAGYYDYNSTSPFNGGAIYITYYYV